MDKQIDNEEHGERRTESIIFDLARKAVGSSVRSLLSSDEGIKKVFSAVIPTDFMANLKQQLESTRESLVKGILSEIQAWLSRIDPAEEIEDLLTGLVFEVRAEISFRKKSENEKSHSAPGALEPSLKSKIKAKKIRKKRWNHEK